MKRIYIVETIYMVEGEDEDDCYEQYASGGGSLLTEDITDDYECDDDGHRID